MRAVKCAFLLHVIYALCISSRGVDARCDKFSIPDFVKQEFYSPNYPYDYYNNLICQLQLTAPEGHRIQIHFHEFHLEPSDSCSLDHIEINEGNSTKHTLIGEYCGSIGPQPIKSTGRHLYLRFKSDASNTYSGFRASYQFLENADCDKFSKGDPEKKEFYSPFYPSNYREYMNCELQLTAPAGHMIRVEFHEFKLRITKGCDWDYVQINEGNTTSHTLVGKYCGFHGPQPFTSQGRYLFFRFKSGLSTVYSGFRASYNFIEDVSCKLFSVGDPEKKEFYSPYYPSNYNKNMSCELQLTAPVGNVIRIEFHEFSLVFSRGCSLDYVEANEGNSTNNSPIGEFCGSVGPQPITSKGRYLYLRFKSDGSSDTSTGFRASYQFFESGSKQLYPQYGRHPRPITDN